MSWRSRFANLFRPRRLSRDIDEELAFHLEMRAREAVEAGAAEAEARRQARRRFGNLTLAAERTRDADLVTWLDTLAADLRYALRAFRRNPGFTAVAVLSLALGIGANTAIFSLLDTVLLKSLPVPEPRQLFLLEQSRERDRDQRFSYPLAERLRERLPAPAALAAYSPPVRLNATIRNGALEPVRAELVSGHYFQTLKVQPALGRLLAPEDNRTPNAHPVAVISDAFWQRRFGRNPGVLGTTIVLNRVPFTVVGVAPPRFFGMSIDVPIDAWVPLMMQQALNYAQNASLTNPDLHKPWPLQEQISWLGIVARIPAPEGNAGAVLKTVYRGEVTRFGQAQADPDERKSWQSRQLDLAAGGRGVSDLREEFSAPLVFLMAIVGLVLLIACANVANLLLARATARRREIAIRIAIGAGRGRLMRQLLTESLALAAAGALVGLAMARAASGLLVRLGSDGPVPPSLVPSLDYRLLAFTAALTLLTAVLFGLVPALQGTRIAPGSSLSATRTGAAAGGSSPLAKSLVVVQVALSLVLLVGAGLFARSLSNLYRADPGYERDRVLTVRIDTRAASYDEARLPVIYQQLTERIEGLPGVRSASVSFCGLATGCARTSDVYVVGPPALTPADRYVQVDQVGLNYFSTVGMPLLAGRDFSSRDGAAAPQVAIVNQELARRYFRDQNPLGRRLTYDPAENKPFEIVGIVRDARINDLRQPVPPMMYLPIAQQREYVRAIQVRTAGDPARVAALLRQAIASVDRNLPVVDIATLAAEVERSFRMDRMVATLAALFGGLALVLASVGLYGVLSYTVVRRTGEMGVRLALGARPRDVVWLVLRDALALVSIGLGAGLAIALAAARSLSSHLFGLSAVDPPSLAVAVLVLVGVAAAAALLPARRAARVAVTEALRSE